MADYDPRTHGDLPHYRLENVGNLDLGFEAYRKTALTKAVRVDGPFVVESREGKLVCEDGYLAIDAHGWPYPIARDEFEAIYEAAG
jgi:hypothetical protein